MENYVIECRNQDLIDEVMSRAGDQQNGDWTTNLQEKVVLEEGDQIICRNTYIDTKAQSQDKIVVLPNTNITIEWVNYQVNWNGNKREYVGSNWVSAQDSVKTPINYLQNVTMPFSDGENYIMCSKTAKQDYFSYVDVMPYNGVMLSQNVGGFNVVFVYKSTSGADATKTIYLKKFWEVGSFVKSQVDVGIVFDNRSPIEAYVANADGTPNLSQKITGTTGTNIKFQDTQMPSVAGNSRAISEDIYEPVVSSKTFLLPEGSYSPDQITEFINNTMTKSTGTPDLDNLTNNSLLIGLGGASQLNMDKNNLIQFTDPTSASDRYGYNISNSKKATPPATGGFDSASRICGASQFVLDYKEEQNKFGFQFLHTPLYSGASGNGSSVEQGGYGNAMGWKSQAGKDPIPEKPDDLPRNVFKMGADGGVVLTKLLPLSFWEDELGFDCNPFIEVNGKTTNTPNPDSILGSYILTDLKDGTASSYTINQQPASIPVWRIMPKVGVNLTSGFLGVASSFEKGSGFQDPIVLGEPTLEGETVDKMVTIDQLVDDITASKQSILAQSVAGFGYFLVEVQAQFDNNFLTPNNNFRHIVAIISRYYEKDAYTSSTSADSLVYTHQGQPVILNSFRCRILNSSKELAVNIGTDNTVFLEIVKQPKVRKDQKK